jgi:hypothetical protein
MYIKCNNCDRKMFVEKELIEKINNAYIYYDGDNNGYCGNCNTMIGTHYLSDIEIEEYLKK